MVHNSVVPASESVTHPTDLDKDSEDLFASPSQPELKSTQVKSMALGSRNLSNPNTKDTANDSTIDADEVREAALRRELAGIRSVNEVIEGVVESLERAKGNMEVGWILLFLLSSLKKHVSSTLDGFPHRDQCYSSAQYLDPHSFPDRAQSTFNSEP
jgi:hypothetical protein